MGLAIYPWSSSLASLQEAQSQVVGPFRILREITPVSFRLALPSNYRISPTFHVSLLKPAGGSRGAEDQEEADDHGAPPIIIDGEEVYRVQEILDSRRRVPGNSVPGGLGGVRPGGAVLGQRRGHSGSLSHHWLP